MGIPVEAATALFAVLMVLVTVLTSGALFAAARSPEPIFPQLTWLSRRDRADREAQFLASFTGLHREAVQGGASPPGDRCSRESKTTCDPLSQFDARRSAVTPTSADRFSAGVA